METGHSSEELMRADPREVGWVALSQGDWEGAKAAFEDSIAAGESPEALEGLGAAAQMLNDDGLTFEARERAYRMYLDGGDRGPAGRVAAWLAADCLLFRGQPAVANG